jgi:hypothetical protein
MSRQYESELKRERDELGELLRQREELETKIAKQLTRVAALSALSEEGEAGKMMETELGGLTNACRVAFRAAGDKGLIPTEVRRALERLQFPTRSHKNILSSVHTVIRRLSEGGEIRRAIHDIHDGEDESVYQWALPSYGASNSLTNQFADADRDRARPRRKG